LIHERFEWIRKESGESSIAALASATSTNEALFLLKKYFKGRVDFRLGDEIENYRKREDDLLRRFDKHPNTQGALDLGLAGAGGSQGLAGLAGLIEQAEAGKVRAMWIAFHPQLVREDAPEIAARIERLIGALEFSVVSTTHEFPWASKASILLPMAAWSEETGTYTNFAGRVQITRRAVMPPGQATPLHVLMSELLTLAGVRGSAEPAARFDPAAIPDPTAILEWMTREEPLMAGMSYDAIGALGMVAPERVANENAAPEVAR
jgi:predicted molibdopterin-dependent oxidoreductase YjgC